MNHGCKKVFFLFNVFFMFERLYYKKNVSTNVTRNIIFITVYFTSFDGFYRAMLCIRGTIAMGLCLPVCLSVSVSVCVCHKSEFY